MKIVELAWRFFVRRGDCWDLGRTNSPTSARYEDGLKYIRIWTTPPRKLVLWDSARFLQYSEWDNDDARGVAIRSKRKDKKAAIYS